MTHFPLYFDLSGRDVLILGGGRHALQRVKKLLPFSPRLTVISEHISEEIRACTGVVCIERAFREEDLESAPVLAIIAEERELSAVIRDACARHRIPVNAVDMPELCDVIFPAVYTTESLSVAVSTGGVSPTAALCLRDSFARSLPDEIDLILEMMPRARDMAKALLPGGDVAPFLREVFDAAVKRGSPFEEAELLELIEKTKKP